jgi:hypothetical protein
MTRLEKGSVIKVDSNMTLNDNENGGYIVSIKHSGFDIAIGQIKQENVSWFNSSLFGKKKTDITKIVYLGNFDFSAKPFINVLDEFNSLSDEQKKTELESMIELIQSLANEVGGYYYQEELEG